MLGVDFNDDDFEDAIKITSNEGRSGDTESVTILDNLVNDSNKYLVGDLSINLFYHEILSGL